MVTATEPRLYCVPTPDTETAEFRAPDGAPPGPWDVTAAYRYCERLAQSHDENFPVGSRFMPASLRPHVWSIYAFARLADDFADEPRFEGRRRELLDQWEELLEASFHHDVAHPVFTALRDTVRRHEIPIRPFQALLAAFRADVTGQRFASFSDLRQFCRFSAEPIGQLVLYVHGHRDPELHRYSDELCTALQLANFLQDISVDLPRGRCYLPQEDLVHFGVDVQQLLAGKSSTEFKELMRFSVARARALFERGRPLIRKVSPGLSMELDATWRSGMRILQHIEDVDYDVLDFRPTLDRRDTTGIAMRALFSFGRRMVRGEA